jgi:glutathione S-transferase
MDLNGGLVPILETPDGTTLHESALIADFASNYKTNKGLKFWPHEQNPGDLAASMKTGKMKLEILTFDKHSSKLLAPIMSRFEDAAKIAACKDILPHIEAFFVKNLNGSHYLSGGPEPMYIDFYCYPWVERLVMLEHSPWKQGFEAIGMNLYPTVCAYVHRFRQHPVLAPWVIT